MRAAPRRAIGSTDLSPILLGDEPVLLGLLDPLEDGLHELVLQPLDVSAGQRRKLHVLVQAAVEKWAWAQKLGSLYPT